MDQVSNPYTPNAGAKPEVLVGRDDQLSTFDVLLQRLARGRTEQSMIVTGLRGVGKTVLLGQFRDKAAELHWRVLEHEVNKNDDDGFRFEIAQKLRTVLLELDNKARWSDRFKRVAAVLASFSVSVDPNGTIQTSLGVSPAEGIADHQDLPMDLTDVFLELGQVARDRKTGIVLLFDEIQFLSEQQLAALIMALHKTVQRNLPITLVGAGLPQVAELAGDAKSYAERLFKFPVIGNLNPEDAKTAFVQPAKAEEAAYTPDALDLAVETTEGYPYFIQELGYAVWGTAERSPITRDDVANAIPVYEAKLDSSFFRVRLDRTSELQSAYLRAMAELGPDAQKASDVASVLNRESTQLGPTRAQLIDMGLLYTSHHGYASFTVPQFDKFMLRVFPELVIPPPRKGKKKSSSWGTTP